tara:strand:+ start:15082 stop:15495 length:414 start_codon:yes stop_codon:yes gene_type:complete
MDWLEGLFEESLEQSANLFVDDSTEDSWEALSEDFSQASSDSGVDYDSQCCADVAEKDRSAAMQVIMSDKQLDRMEKNRQSAMRSRQNDRERLLNTIAKIKDLQAEIAALRDLEKRMESDNRNIVEHCNCLNTSAEQ